MSPFLPSTRVCRLRHIVLATLLAVGTLLVAAPVAAQDTDEATDDRGDEGMSLDEISRALDNPLGNLWLIFTENQMQRFRGFPADGSQWVNTLLIQPILPVPLTEDWNLVTRPIIPLVTAPRFNAPAGLFGDCPPNCNSRPPPDQVVPSSLDSDRKTRWCDIMLW